MDEPWMIELQEFWRNMKAGDLVRDGLTGGNCKIISIADGVVHIDSPHLDGGRFPWEVSQPVNVSTLTQNAADCKDSPETLHKERECQQ